MCVPGGPQCSNCIDDDGDGKIDVVVVDNFDADRIYTLINDGSGHFTREATSRLPTAMRTGAAVSG